MQKSLQAKPKFSPFFPVIIHSLSPAFASPSFFIATREKKGCLERRLEKEESFGPASKVYFCFSLPAARANGLVQCADFCRKLPETVCIFVSLSVCVCCGKCSDIPWDSHLLELWASDLARKEVNV